MAAQAPHGPYFPNPSMNAAPPSREALQSFGIVLTLLV